MTFPLYTSLYYLVVLEILIYHNKTFFGQMTYITTKSNDKLIKVNNVRPSKKFFLKTVNNVNNHNINVSRIFFLLYLQNIKKKRYQGRTLVYKKRNQFLNNQYNF